VGRVRAVRLGGSRRQGRCRRQGRETDVAKKEDAVKLRELLWLLPALALYVAVVIAFAPQQLVGDEGRYLDYARNLTHGYFTTREEPNLWSGPGYPLLIMPLVAADAPPLVIKLLNAPLVFVGICLMYATARQYTGRRNSLLFAWLLAVYPPFVRHLPYTLTEALALALVCAGVYCLTRWHRTPRLVWLIVSALVFACLALTKIFFGWVLMVGAAVFLVLALVKPLRPLWRLGVVLALALAMCTPYLAYTYWLTGKPLMWGTSGGLSLYFMTTPYPEEYGDWWGVPAVMNNQNLARHKPFFVELEKLGPLERDARLRQEAFNNIRRHPLKFVQNWMLNVTRMLFSYPYSYTPQKPTTLFYLVPNMLLVSLALFLVYPTIVGRRRIPSEVFVVLALAGLALGGNSLLSSHARWFALCVPMLALWMLVALVRVVRIQVVGDRAGETAGREHPSMEVALKGQAGVADAKGGS
jgi:4-amino-4-deoxy-L-arabinose transferase-like glycosyltransferase